MDWHGSRVLETRYHSYPIPIMFVDRANAPTGFARFRRQLPMSTIMSKQKKAIATSQRQAPILIYAASALIGLLALAIGNSTAFAQSLTETFATHDAQSEIKVDHTAWNTLLSKFVAPSPDGINRINYKRFKDKGQQSLKSYIKQLTNIDPRTLNQKEQFAYWANLYNAKTIDVILDHYPVASIRDISLEKGLFDLIKKSVGAGGPWKTKVLTVAGQGLSLDNIEHDILRPIFEDPRVHYAVNCASIGCPNLGVVAFTGENLEEELNKNAKAYINQTRGINVDKGKVTASSIYKWFVDDFGGDEQGVLKHVRKFASSDLKSKLENVTEIDSYDYDWSLNDTKR